MREAREPPRALTVVLLAALAALIVYPVHRPYLHPDQDIPPALPLIQMARGSWSPLILMYGSALPNLLHVFDGILLDLGRLAGWWRDSTDLLMAWCEAPWLFRIPARVIAMVGAIASLVAARGLTALVADPWSALAAPALLGTWILFVRESHHGWYDAPATGSAMLALWAATAAVRSPRSWLLVAAGALAGLATSFKFNLAPTILAVLATAVVAERGRRLRSAVVITVAALAAFAITTPESVLETARLYAYVAAYIPIQGGVLATAAGAAGNRLAETLGRSFGWAGLATGAVGLALAVGARDRAFAPLLAFVALYAVVLLRTPLALARYALPIAGPLAVLAAYGLSRVPLLARMVVVAGLVGLGLPGCVRYVRLLAVEDTRVEAARLVRAAWGRDERVVLAANPVLAVYVGPDLPPLPRFDPGIPPAVEQAIAARAPRCVHQMETLREPIDASGLRSYAGALVITVDPPAPFFERASTAPEVAALLAREATLVTDLVVERRPAARDYEVFDLNYVPFTGLGTLVRPGPRLRLWRVPDDAGSSTR
jgi:hypothetical protein